MFSQFELKSNLKKATEKIFTAKLGLNYFEEPYKHLIIDNFLEDKIANACLKNFPDLTDPEWEFANDKDIEIKYRTKWSSEFDIPMGIVDAIRILNGADFLRAISGLFQIEKLIPDPYFTGGGLNVTRKGGASRCAFRR
jgi:hypothetical protein